MVPPTFISQVTTANPCRAVNVPSPASPSVLMQQDAADLGMTRGWFLINRYQAGHPFTSAFLLSAVVCRHVCLYVGLL